MTTIKTISSIYKKQEQNSFATTKSDEFYRQMPWRNLRKQKITASPLCEDCLEAGNIIRATDVHHIYSRKTHPELELEYNNLRSLCQPCHKRITAKQGASSKHKQY